MNKTSPPTDKATQDNHQHDEWLNSLLDGRAELVFSLMCGAALLAGWLGPKISAMPDGVAFGLLLAAYFFGGYFTLKEAIEKVSRGKFEIDFLMLVAAGGRRIRGNHGFGHVAATASMRHYRTGIGEIVVREKDRTRCS